MTKRSVRSSVALACRRGVAVLGLGIAGVVVGAGVAAADDDGLGGALASVVTVEETFVYSTDPVVDDILQTERTTDAVALSPTR